MFCDMPDNNQVRPRLQVLDGGKSNPRKLKSEIPLAIYRAFAEAKPIPIFPDRGGWYFEVGKKLCGPYYRCENAILDMRAYTDDAEVIEWAFCNADSLEHIADEWRVPYSDRKIHYSLSAGAYLFKRTATILEPESIFQIAEAFAIAEAASDWGYYGIMVLEPIVRISHVLRAFAVLGVPHE